MEFQIRGKVKIEAEDSEEAMDIFKKNWPQFELESINIIREFKSQ